PDRDRIRHGVIVPATALRRTDVRTRLRRVFGSAHPGVNPAPELVPDLGQELDLSRLLVALEEQLAARTMKNSTVPMIRKLTRAVMNFPYRTTPLPRSNVRSLKLGLPNTAPITAMITSFTSDDTTRPNAMPMTTATARSITLPRSRNFLRSWSTAPPRSALVRCRTTVYPKGHGLSPVPRRSLADLAQLPLELGDLVPQARRLLEAEVLGGVVHLVLESLDELADVVGRHTLEIEHRRPLRGAPAGPPATTTRTDIVFFSFARPHHLEDVDDLLADRLWVDAVRGIELQLHLPPAVRLGDGTAHRIGHLAGVHDYLSVDVAGRATHRLDPGGVGAQGPLLVGVEGLDH